MGHQKWQTDLSANLDPVQLILQLIRTTYINSNMPTKTYFAKELIRQMFGFVILYSGTFHISSSVPSE